MVNYKKYIIKSISAFEMWTYRKIFRISWNQKVIKEEILEAKVNKRLYHITQTKKLKYLGHITRQSRDTLRQTVLDGKVNVSRGCGRPRTKWSTNITAWIGLEYHLANQADTIPSTPLKNQLLQPESLYQL